LFAVFEIMSYIPGQIERGEMRAEAAYDEMIQPDGKMKCPCGELFDPDSEGETLSPDPYAMPVCGKCCEEYFSSANSQAHPPEGPAD
jgi:hypothetical protein